MTTTTASMQEFGVASRPDAALRGGTSAGLVLLHSPIYEQLQPAYTMTAGEAYIGREPACAICVPERAVSRRHAMLRYEDGAWVLRDLGGANGTIVDGVFVSEVELEHLAEIRVGDTVFKFVSSGAEAYTPYRIDGTMIAGAKRRTAGLTELLGGMQVDKIGAQLERIAPVELSIVIQGESGTGKEVVARELHRMSGRKGPLQAINCAAIPANLIESELFGYKRGAFSGADRDKTGLIAAAHNGTLLLDEIGDMPLEAQAKLLRVIQAREVYPLGATAAHKIEVRFACATNRDLARFVREGRFRGDLLARLNEFSLVLPPLRERKEDIFLLARALLARHGASHLRMPFPYMLALLHYDWPYNVRELESCLKRSAAICDGVSLDPRNMPEAVREATENYGRRQSAEEAQPMEKGCEVSGDGTRSRRGPRPTEEQLRHLLATHRGNVAAVGRELGKERMQIHRWMHRYGIVVEEYRS